jgi:SAM-dependent methyltransferase
MRLAMTGEGEAEIEGALRRAIEAANENDARSRLDAVAALWRSHPDAFPLLRKVLSQADHAATAGWGGIFDAVARDQPEAAVALYSLGDPQLLEDATAEITGWLDGEGLLAPGSCVVDAGCGIGRIAAALASKVSCVIGTEISAAMLDEARVRADASNILLLRTGEIGLRCLAEASADLVLAIDVAPYWVLSDLLDENLAEAARVLCPGGSLVMMNLSYRADDEADRRDLERLAADIGFSPPSGPVRPFHLWDGAVWRLVRQ